MEEIECLIMTDSVMRLRQNASKPSGFSYGNIGASKNWKQQHIVNEAVYDKTTAKKPLVKLKNYN